jgi:type VI secretion system secreted protein Hcp
MALEGAMWIKFEGSIGAITGDSVKDKRKGALDIIAGEHDFVSPRDPATGQATGKRAHKPWKTTVVYQNCIPQLYDALARNESAKEVKMEFYSNNALGKHGGVGTEALHYRVTLKDAFISRLQHVMLNTRILAQTERADNKFVEHHINIEWVYGEITWEWLINGNKMANDNWKIVR